jgi:ABC-2 type transport system permease protein
MNTPSKKSTKYNAIITFLILICIALIINFLASLLYTRVDLTAEKRYSLSSPTKKMIGNVKDKIYIKVYLEGNDLPSGFLRLRNSTKDILNEFKSLSGNKIKFEFIDPFAKASSDKEKKAIYESLVAKGLIPTNLKLKSDESYTEKILFPAMAISMGEVTIPVQILENQIGYQPEQALNNSIILLEYKIANAIKKISRRTSPSITFMQGYGTLPPQNVVDIQNTLKSASYKVDMVDITAQHASTTTDSVSNWINEDLTDVLVIAKPTMPFSEKDKFRIDQYIMKGGKVLWLIDPMAAEMDMLRNEQMMFMAQKRELNLDDMLFKYGVRLNPSLLQDAQYQNPIPIVDNSNGQPMLYPWLYFPLLSPNNGHSIGRNLDPVAGYFVSSIDTIQNNIQKKVLLHTTAYSRALLDPVRVHLSAIKEKPDMKYFKQQNIPVGVLLEGKFTSLFKNRLDYVFLSQLEKNNIKVLEEGVASKMIVLADGDIIKNDVGSKGNVFPLGYNQYTEQTLSNKDFIVNCIEYLVDDDGLIESRNKEIKLRLLDRQKVKEQKIKYQLINTILPILFIVLLGMYWAWNRKKKFAK